MSSNWTDVINCIKDKSEPTLLYRTETFNVIKIIVKREHEILNHNEEYNAFFDHLIALLAESIATIPIAVSQTKLLNLLEATNLIIRYIVKRFESPNAPIILLKALKSLCDVDAPLDNYPAYACLKNMKHPDNSKSSNGSGSDKDSPKSETVKRSRSELSIVIMQQLTQPLTSSGTVPLTNFSETQFDFTELFRKEVMDLLKSLNANDVLLKWCINCIPIISTNYSLKYDTELVLQQKLLHLPQTNSDAQSIKQCLKQIDIDTNNILHVLQLPIMDPLTKVRIQQLSQLSMSSLYCCIVTTVAHSIGMISSSTASTQTSAPKSTSVSTQQNITSSTANNKEVQTTTPEVDPCEEVSRSVVNQSLEIFKKVSEILKKHAQNNVYQNHLCIGGWILLAGIQGAMSASSGTQKSSQLQTGSDEFVKSKSPSRHADQSAPQPRVNLFKVQQGFGILNVTIAKYSIKILKELLDELKIDSGDGIDLKFSDDILIAQQQQLSQELINFNIMKPYSSMDRIICAFSGTTIQQLMTFLATIAYRKACALKHLTEFGGEQLSYSDSTTYFNDTLSCSEDDSDTEDEGEGEDSDEESSDGYLGSWLKEALSPEGNDAENDKNDKNDENQKTNSQFPAKDEPHEYLELASQIFQFLDAKLGDAENKFLIKYVRHGLSEQQMVLLANILKDLDSDVQIGIHNCPMIITSSNVSTNDATNAAIQWKSSMVKFSSSIGKYMHNLISNSLLSESLQSLLLQNLGVSPWANDTNNWPLEVYSRILAVVVQILLLKPSQEKEAACLSVWHRLVNTLVEGVCGNVVSQFDEYDDLNIEHAQLLLFLFHSLNLMQKKSILLLVAGGVIRCAEVCRVTGPEKPLRDVQLILLSRLLLFLEYLMKHLYNPPEILLEQVSWNLFSVFSIDSDEKNAGLMNYKLKMAMFYRKDIEEKYRKLSTVHDGITIKPKLYSLTAIDPSKQNEFKLDGLAWNFILCTPDKVKYPLLIDSLVSILNITDMSTGKIPHHSQFSIYYCHSLAWKLLLGLPPSTSHVENLISLEDKQVNLHTLIWSTRCLKPVASGVHSHNLIVDCLIRQGMYTQAAETMWSNLTEKLNDYNHVLTAAKLGLESFLQTFQSQTPRLSKVIMLDSLLSHLYYYQTLAANGEAKSDDQTVSSSRPPSVDESMSKSLLEKLIQTLELVMGVFNKTMAMNLSGQVPQKIMDAIIAISGTRNNLAGDLAENLLRSIQSSDKEVLNIEWKRPMCLGDTNIQQPEQITLNVVEAHLVEVYRHQNFSILLSLKSVIRSLINWIYYMLPHYDNSKPDTRLQNLLVQMLFDVRTDFIYDSITKCLESLIGSDSSSENFQLPAYMHLIQQTYTILIEYCESSMIGSTKSMNIDESALHDIIRYYESLTEKPNGLKALKEFFCERKFGNLVNILLSFSGTNLTQQYSHKVLKFFEKLFQVSENMDSSHSIDEVCSSLADLGTVDSGKLRNWLSHILLGPKGLSIDGGSATSSNFPTPTNLGTQSSAPPSLPIDKKSGPETAEAMEVDEECSKVGLPSIANWTTIAHSSSNDQAVGGAPESVENNGKLLQILTKYIVAENRVSTNVSQALFQAMLQLGNNLLTSPTVTDAVLSDFTSLFQVMVTLADADQGHGHSALFASSIEWLEVCKNRALEKYNKNQSIVFTTGTNTAKIQLDNITALLKYFSDLLIGINGQQRPLSSVWDDDVTFDIEEIIANDRDGENEELETTVEDSDEDTNNKLCTYTITQKDFMNQHWYWCYTCKMVDDKGCCSICARVCHKNHDVCYAKFGNFYCDCGAKEDGSCRAMSLLDNNASTIPSSTTLDHGEILISSLKRQTSSSAVQPCSDILSLISNKPSLAKMIDASKDQLSSAEMWRNVLKCLLNFCNNLLPIIRDNCAKFSTVGCHTRAKNSLERLHLPEKAFTYSEQVMIATLGSQEGAFENVRMNYSGDQGQTIRQLLSSNLIRRVALCALSSPQGKRQHLAVSHEKGKVTILQLSALLKQADAAKKKLTLTRLSSVPITCSVLSLAANSANEDLLAVCGLRECHVLTFTANGTVSDHIVLTLQLDNGNYLRRAIWLPGSQTKLALVTAEYVKIYDLAEDSISPLYNFVVPSGDIRDVCFVLQEETYFLLIMSSLGYIYTQPLSDESLAAHGAFYVTNTLELDHSYIRDVNGQILGGGVSIYYSHTLQVLFFSYAAGKSFMAPLVDVNEGVKCVVNLMHSSKVFSKGSSNGSQSPLCQWMEILGHPGLICAMQQSTNNPVIFMLKPEGYLVQEIKAQNSKAKIMDMVAIRHQVSGTEKTTLILLCEDGSLRIYAANPEVTNYWLSSEIQPIGNYYNSGIIVKERLGSKKKAKKSSSKQLPKMQQLISGTNPIFPVDFFEHCTPLHDVEFGGNDLLEIYNTQQLQHRLNSTGFYVASTRFNGFTLEVNNKDSNVVITGIRFLIGSQDLSRAPTAVTILGRKIPTICTRPRWFAIPLTREESLQSDKKLNIHFSPSQDPEFVTMLDSIKIYGKTKESFGFPDEIFDDSGAVSSSSAQIQQISDSDSQICNVTPLDKMVTSMLDVVDSGFYFLGGSSVDSILKQSAIDVTTSLLLLPTPGVVQQLSRSVLATLHPTKSQYHQYKDREILNEISKELQFMLGVTNFKNIDPEGFYRLVLMVRNIAIQRPQQLTKICQENQYPIVTSLMTLTKELHRISSNYDESIIHYGLTHKEATIQSLIEIFYAFIYTDSGMIDQMIKFIVELLLDKDPQVSHSAKYAIIRLLRPKCKRQRKVLIESTTPPSCQTPTPQSAPIIVPPQEDVSANIQDVDLIEPLGLVAGAGAAENRDLVEPSLEALLGMAGNGPALGGRDGEALMEFALELYLHEYDGDIQAFQGLANRLRGNQAFQAVAQAAGIDLGAANQPRVNNSAGGSDDDDEAISNAATDGSRDVNQMLATSPSAEQLIDNTADGGNGSDGSGESMGGASGRSSTYDEPMVTSSNSPPKMNSKLEAVKDEEDICEQENSAKLHQLRVAILEKMIDNFAAIDEVNGRQVIPFMQVILMLTTDLDGTQEAERNVMTKLLSACIEKLEMSQPAQLSTRSSKSEVKLIIIRYFGILMGKLKTSSSKSSSAASSVSMDNIQFVASSTASYLTRSGAITYCLTILESFLPYWRQNSASSDSNSSQNPASGAHIVTSGGMPTNSLLKPTLYGPVPDMQPFFARQYIKGLTDIFELYPQVLTEMAVRLPYQILKLTNSNSNQQQHTYDSALTFTLCEYMLHMQSPSIRRQVRKLLLYMCGNKERYRKLRDLHSLNEHMKAIRASLNSSGLTYQSLVSLMDHLKACYEIASARTGNWQRFCLLNTDILSSLLSLSCQQLDHEQISTIILQLLQAAVVNTNSTTTPSIQEASSSSTGAQVKTKDRKDRDKSEELDNLGTETKFDPANCNLLVQQIFNQVSMPNLSLFIKTFLLETNSINIRWLAHGLIYAFYENCNEANKSKLLEVLFALWPMIPVYGKRTPQFIDLIGFFTLNTKSVVHLLPEKISKAVKLLREQNEFVAKHPSASLYSSLGQVLDLDGFYLESEPCLVCNSVDQSFNIIKLTSIKMDSKFTTNSNIIKLVNSHIISKIILRIGDLKRTKMVRTINVFYNSRNVQAVVELKNRPSMWHKAKSVTLQSGQTDVKIELSLPITASNIMFEYEDFYETVTSLPESLQCPRCSATVPANPGVCNNCGEHVFQCHKCRAIHYDEKDPFICQSCGFCKYAKFDYSIYGRPTSAVDSVESDEDRAKTVQTINNLLEKADKSYREILNVRQSLELLIPKVADGGMAADLIGGTVSSTMHINKIVQQMEKKYCSEGKTHFEDLTKIVQKIQACRRELVAYDKLQMDTTPVTPVVMPTDSYDITHNRCYGCALASIEQILTLLRGMGSQIQCRMLLCSEGLIEELATNNLRHGTDQKIQEEVRNLLCLLTRDLPEPTERLCNLLKGRVLAALEGSVPLSNLDNAVRNEMALLEAMAMQEDTCWQMKLKPIVELFKKASNDPRGPVTPIVQPCLRVIQFMCNPPAPTSKKNKGKSSLDLCTVKPSEGISVNTQRWLDGDKQHSYEVWKSRQSANAPVTPQPVDPKSKADTFMAVMDEKRQQTRRLYLTEKYGHRWLSNTVKKRLQAPLKLIPNYLPSILFHPTSRLVRVNACSLVTSWMSTHERKIRILNLLTGFLKYIGESGEASGEFIDLFKQIAQEAPYRQYLALNHVITKILDLLNNEFEKIYRLEESTSLSTDLGQGYALKQYVDLISMFLENPQIIKAYKGVVLQNIIQSYLNLRKLVVQRTMYIDEAQKSLMNLLEELTSGTEEETAAFMAICIDIVRKTPPNDLKTPLFMFERLCSTIHSEDSDNDEFFLNLEKDQLQEEFIQGRMLGNPYPSTEPGLGPLMRDVKNKICFDCEIMAMLEDDNGMELLVHNKIISLDLPVKEVYKRVWLAGGGERDTMRIVYRIRGLSGDATEEFIENLKPTSAQEEDNEQIYRMVNVIVDCGGLKVILDRMSYLQNVSKSKPFLQTLLKLFLMCVKVKKCREELCQPELRAISTLLKVLHLSLQHQVQENDPQMSTVTEQLLEIMETILAKAASDSLDSFLQFSLTFGGPEYIEALLSCTNHANVRNNRCLIRVVAALVYGNDIKMALLCDYFKNCFDFEKFDVERTPEEEFQLELFCILCSAIEKNSIGGILKDYIMGLGIVDKAINYIVKYAPTNRIILLPFASSLDSEELKIFISKPSLKYILQFLSGLANKHEKTQLAVAKELIPIVHQLEQVSSDEHVGSLAENLLEALSSEPATAKTVQEYRDSTKAEKKRLAMATREKQLNAMGMRTNEKGQVTAKEQVLQELDNAMADLVKQETGLTCFICREGYASQPNQVMGIYTFTKRCPLEEFEQKSRKTMGYATVSHFNVVHTNCHMSAIRISRGRDEWESASLQNTNTKCNGLLPLWGPEVSETAFSASMARQHSYLQDSTQRIEITFVSGIQDLKLLLLRFAHEKSFHSDAGGGGPQSNMHLVPYLMFFSLYISLSTRLYTREEKSLSAFLNQPVGEKWLESAYEIDGPTYQIALSIVLHTPELWMKNRIKYLKRLIVIYHVRHLYPTTTCKALNGIGDKDPKDYSVYKGGLMLFALVELIYKYFFNKVINPKDEDWPVSLFNYIRKNDEAMLKSAVTVLENFREEYLPCTSFGEFCDVAGLFDEIDDPDRFLSELLQSLPGGH